MAVMSFTGSKPPGPQYSGELLADIALYGFKRCVEEFHPAQKMLLASRSSRVTRRLHHVDDNWLVRFLRAGVAADAHRQVKIHVRVVAGRGIDRACANLLEGLPVPEGDVGV